jgi:hypothetical protein
MAETGHKQALEAAVAEARTQELKRLAEDLGQLDLFDVAVPVQAAPVPVVNGHREQVDH